jgi:hypothetical protein
VIVVNTGGGGLGVGPMFGGQPFRSAGATCLTTSGSSCCGPISDSRANHHNIIAKQHTHYVVVNKPKPTAASLSLSSTPTSSMMMTSTQSSSSAGTPFSAKCSPTKLRLWQPTHSSTPTTPRPVGGPQVLVSTRSRSHPHCLPPEDVESDCMDDRMFFKYLNLIPSRESATKSGVQLLTEWPLRKITRIPKPETDLNGRLLLANFKVTVRSCCSSFCV